MLNIATNLKLDPDYVGGGTLALLAKKGAGKSYTARVMAEEFWREKVPFVLVDPMGTSYGLRSSADGRGDGLGVIIIGGKRGDLPLERTAGATIADLIMDEGLSAVLDLSELGSRSAEREFMLKFLDRIYRGNRNLLHLLVDEADLFAPQQPQPGDKPLLGVTENIVRRGRNKAIGVTLITQRPAVLNKDVLTQVDGLVVLRTTGLTDRKAIDEWVKGHGHDDEAKLVKESLSGLKNGESWWWIPELEILERVQVRQSFTFDSSPTRTRGGVKREPKTFADVDLGALTEKMSAAIERAKAEDPAELRKEIARLKKELQSRPTETQEVRVEVPRIPSALSAAAAQVVKHDRALAVQLRNQADSLESLAGALEAELQAEPEVATPVPTSKPPRAAPAPRPPRAEIPVSPNGEVSRPQQKILNSLATLEAIRLHEPGRTQVALFAGVSPRSSGFEKNVSTLRTGGYIDFPMRGLLQLTDEGRAIATTDGIPQTAQEMHEYVRALVGEAKWNVLSVLIGVYPESMTREDLAERADVSAQSSGFEKNLSTLKSLGLITYPQRGHAVAQPVLFLEGA